MGKLIAVCGSAGSGKTTFSVKFAETLYHRSHGKHSVIALFCDIVTPSIPVIFPNRKEEDLFSVGSVLSKTDFYADDVVSHMMMTKDRMNLGYLGYLSGENQNSFPEYKDVRAKNFLKVPFFHCGIHNARNTKRQDHHGSIYEKFHLFTPFLRENGNPSSRLLLMRG